MGNQKQKWTVEEEEALKAGVAKHGLGKWKNILVDSKLGPRLASRSNVDLKDKWRNMYGSHGQGSRGSAPTPKAKATAPSAVLPKTQTTSSVFISKDNAVDNAARSSKDAKNVPKYNTLIFEALSSIKDPRGSDMGAIARFIEQKYEVPQKFRRLLSSKLRKLVLQGKLEKVQRNFKLKDSALGTKTPTPKQKDYRPRPAQQSGSIITRETAEDKAKMLAHNIAEAENKAFVAAEAVKEYERISQMVADADAVVTVFTEIFEQCSQGEVILVV